MVFRHDILLNQLTSLDKPYHAITYMVNVITNAEVSPRNNCLCGILTISLP